MKCLQCNKVTSNPKFCSRSCSASYNNLRTNYPKRVAKLYYCGQCGAKTHYRRKLCQSCKPDVGKRTKGELATGNANSFGYPQIREHARKQYNLLHPKPKCEICGYTKHVEIHHRKSIRSFDDSCLVLEINSTTNLVGLCPNHHWEADHGHIIV